MSFFLRHLEEATDRKHLGRAIRKRHQQKYHKAKNNSDKRTSKFHKEKMRAANRFIANENHPKILNPNNIRRPKQDISLPGLATAALGIPTAGLAAYGLNNALEEPTIVDTVQNTDGDLGDMDPTTMAGIIAAVGTGGYATNKMIDKSGKKLQEDIDFDEYLDPIKDVVGDVRDTITPYIDQAGGKFNDLKSGFMTRYNDFTNNFSDNIDSVKDKGQELAQMTKEKFTPILPQDTPEQMTNQEEYNDVEKELSQYLRKELPDDSFDNMKNEIKSHSETRLFDNDPAIKRDYNQGFINRASSNLMEDPKTMSRAEIADYIDNLYNRVQGKDNKYMDYGDNDNSFMARARDIFGKANPDGSFDDVYMQDLDPVKQNQIDKIVSLRDQLIQLQKNR